MSMIVRQVLLSARQTRDPVHASVIHNHLNDCLQATVTFSICRIEHSHILYWLDKIRRCALVISIIDSVSLYYGEKKEG